MELFLLSKKCVCVCLGLKGSPLPVKRISLQYMVQDQISLFQPLNFIIHSCISSIQKIKIIGYVQVNHLLIFESRHHKNT